MQKIKLFFSICIAVILSVMCVACGGRTEKPPANSSSSSTTIPDEKNEYYTITYLAVEGGKVVELNPLMYEAYGSYPTQYEAGEEVYISPLKSGYVDISPNEDRVFKGWYADEACTFLYSTSTTKEHNYALSDKTYTTTEYGGFRIKTKGDIVIYAKLSCGYWYGPY